MLRVWYKCLLWLCRIKNKQQHQQNSYETLADALPSLYTHLFFAYLKLDNRHETGFIQKTLDPAD